MDKPTRSPPPRTSGPNRFSSTGSESDGPEDDLPVHEGTETRRRYSSLGDRSRCRFCREKVVRVDYKDVLVLEKMCTSQGRLFSRKRSGNCARCQRSMKKAIKQARYIGLLPYTI